MVTEEEAKKDASDPDLGSDSSLLPALLQLRAGSMAWTLLNREKLQSFSNN